MYNGACKIKNIDACQNLTQDEGAIFPARAELWGQTIGRGAKGRDGVWRGGYGGRGAKDEVDWVGGFEIATVRVRKAGKGEGGGPILTVTDNDARTRVVGHRCPVPFRHRQYVCTRVVGPYTLWDTLGSYVIFCIRNYQRACGRISGFEHTHHDLFWGCIDRKL